MITLLGTLIGFVSSIFPHLIEYFREKQQIEKLKAMKEMDLEAANAVISAASYQHDQSLSSGGSRWIEGVRALVRPLITYSLFFLWLYIKYMSYKELEFWSAVWDEEDQAIFAAIISFWFGHRYVRPTVTNKAAGRVN